MKDAKALATGRKRSPLRRLLQGTLASEVLRLAFQSAMFIALARALGPDQLGRYSAIMAIVSFATPLVGLGAPHWLIRQAKRDPANMDSSLSSALTLILISGSIASVACSIIAIPISQIDWWIGAILAISELIGTSVCTLLAFVALANGNGKEYAYCTALPAGIKMSAAFALLLFDIPTLKIWATLYAFAAVLSLLLTLPVFSGHYRRPSMPSKRQVTWGSQVAVSQLSQGAVNDLDKPVLTSNEFVVQTGEYAAAYRLLNLSYFAIRAFETAVYPRFFETGKEGIRSVDKLLLRTLIVSVSYGVLCALAAQVLAPISTIIFGPEFSSSAMYLKMLAFLLPIKFAQWFIADALTGLDRQGLRSILQAGSAALMLVLLLILIPRHGVQGAILSTYLVESLYLAALVMVYWRCRSLSKSSNRPNL